jgi:hypothetical protein
MSANVEYLEEAIRLATQVEGPILECGSGLTTLMFGLLAKRRDVIIWTLEHLPEWHELMRKTLSAYGISNVRLCLAPLRDFGDFTWYDAPADQMPLGFRLVVCDGPPGMSSPSVKKAAGARYGLLPVLGRHLAPSCVVLLDDAGREEEAGVIERWRQEYRVRATVVGNDHRFSVIRLPHDHLLAPSKSP